MISSDYSPLIKFISTVYSECPYCKVKYDNLMKHIQEKHFTVLKGEADDQLGKPANEKADDAEQEDIMPKTELDSFLQEQDEPTSIQTGANESPDKVGEAENQHTPEGMEDDDNYEDVAAGVFVDSVLKYAKKTDSGYYICPICQEVFDDENSLNDHTIGEHTDLIDREKEDYETPDDGKPVHHKYDYMSEGANYYKFNNPIKPITNTLGRFKSRVSNKLDEREAKRVNISLTTYRIMLPVSRNKKSPHKIKFEGKYYVPALAENFYSPDGKTEDYVNLAAVYMNSKDLSKLPRQYKIPVIKLIQLWEKEKPKLIDNLNINPKNEMAKKFTLKNYYSTVNYLADMYKKLHPKLVTKGRRSRGIYGEIATQRRTAEEKARRAKWNAGSFHTGNSKEKKHKIVAAFGDLAPTTKNKLEPFFGIYCEGGDVYNHLGILEQMLSLPKDKQREWLDKIPSMDEYAVIELGRVWNSNYGLIMKRDQKFGEVHFAYDLKGLVDFLNWQMKLEEEGEKYEEEGKHEKVPKPKASIRDTSNKRKTYSDDEMEDIINMMRERYKRNLGKGLSQLSENPDFKYVYDAYKRVYYDRDSALYGIPFKRFVQYALASARQKENDAKEKIFSRVLEMINSLDERELQESEKRRSQIRERKRREEENTKRWNDAYAREAKKPQNRGYWTVGEDGRAVFVLPDDDKEEEKKGLDDFYDVELVKFDYDTEVSDVVKEFVERLRYQGTVGDEWMCPYDKAIFVTPNAMALHLLQKHSSIITKIVEAI